MWLEPSTGSYQRAVPARRARPPDRRRPDSMHAACRPPSPPSLGNRPAGRSRRLGRFVVAPPLVGRRRLGGRPPGRAAVRAAGARRRCRAGGFILDDLESARAKALARGRARRRRRRRSSSSSTARHARGRHAGVRGRRGGGAIARRRRRAARRPGRARTSLAPRQVSADGHTAYDIVFLDLPPDDSPDALPDPARSASTRRPGSTSSWPAARRSTATSRPCPRPTCGGASSSRCRWPRSRCSSSSARVVAAGVPLAVGGAAVLVALAGDLRRRVGRCR